jgi:uncharacterized protein (TIGR03083 family)
VSRVPTQRCAEAEAYFEALQDRHPETVSSCAGWTIHEVTAHLTGIAAEVSRHLAPYLEGELVPLTQSFEVREAPYRAMRDNDLRARLETEETRMRSLIDEVLALDREAIIPWTGREMVVAKFIPHLRNEFAIHRWDVCGDDDLGDRLLAQPELTEHAVSVLGAILLRKGLSKDPDSEGPFAVRLKSPGTVDVRVIVEGTGGFLELSDADADEPFLEMDAAARVLLIWGRRPDRRSRVRSFVSAETLARLATLLAGY